MELKFYLRIFVFFYGMIPKQIFNWQLFENYQDEKSTIHISMTVQNMFKKKIETYVSLLTVMRCGKECQKNIEEN